MRRRRGRVSSSVDVNLLYALLSKFLPKKVAITIIVLMIGLPFLFCILLTFSPLILNKILLPDNIGKDLKIAEKTLNKAAKITIKNSDQNTFNSNGLAEYFGKGIENSIVDGNKLKTDFAEFEFDGDGICISSKSCSVKFNSSAGRYTVYLKNNGKGLIKTCCGYSWTSAELVQPNVPDNQI